MINYFDKLRPCFVQLHISHTHQTIYNIYVCQKSDGKLDVKKTKDRFDCVIQL